MTDVEIHTIDRTMHSVCCNNSRKTRAKSIYDNCIFFLFGAMKCICEQFIGGKIFHTYVEVLVSVIVV